MLRELISKRIEYIGVSKLKVANKAGMSPGHLYNWLNKKRDIRVDTLERIIVVIGEIEFNDKQFPRT